MEVCHWNISKYSDPMFATKKYENALANRLNSCSSEVRIERQRRRENTLLGSTPIAWMRDYRNKTADVVHATFQTIAPAVYFNQLDNFVITVHDLNPIRYSPRWFDVSEQIQWRVTPPALKRADAIIAISEFTEHEIRELTTIDPSAIEVVPQGVDHNLYQPIDQDKARDSLGLNTSTKYVLVVSSNAKHKRMDLAKDIFSKLREKDSNIKLLKAGYGDTLNGPGVQSVGWLPEEKMPLLYNAADVYLHTSEYEGFGLPILEAMACGVPVIANKQASIPEIATDESLVDMTNFDPATIADIVQSRLDLDQDYAALARSKHFSWERTAQETLEVYRKV